MLLGVHVDDVVETAPLFPKVGFLSGLKFLRLSPLGMHEGQVRCRIE